MEVAQLFLGPAPAQKWPAAAGWERGERPKQLGAPTATTNPHEIQLEKQHKGTGGLTACGAPREGSTNAAPKGGGQLGRGGQPPKTKQNHHKGTLEMLLAVK